VTPISLSASASPATSFAEFFEATHGAVFRAVLLVAKNWPIAQDATATAYLRALEKWPEVSCHPAPAAWVTRVALNNSVSWWRKARRTIGVSQSASQAVIAPDFPDPDLRNAIDALPLRQRQVLALRLVLGFDVAETAHILGIAPGTVGAHLNRALSSCRTRLEAKSVGLDGAGEVNER
jgi:RNA polymerase sigma factor (sigma-70 family)